MPNADSEHSRKVLSIMAKSTGIPELRKMIHDHEKSITLFEERLGFSKIAVDVFTKELETREKK